MHASIKFVRNALLAAVSGLLFWGCAGNGGQAGAMSPAKGVSFSEADRSRIVKYYTEARRLPVPAPAAQYKPGDRLPSGARPQPLPDALKLTLSETREPYARLVIGADVILVDRVSHTIADVVPAVAY